MIYKNFIICPGIDFVNCVAKDSIIQKNYFQQNFFNNGIVGF